MDMRIFSGIHGLKVRPLLGLCLLTLLLGCEQAAEPRPDVIKAVSTFAVESPTVDGTRRLPAKMEASQRVELSFRVSGKLTELAVRESDRVVEGQVLAKLDQSDYRNRLDDRKAAFVSARDDFERAKTLIIDEAISQRDYDEVLAEFRTTGAAYEQAKVDLQYTVLRAPFDGEVSTRLVENFEEVAAGQQVFYLADTSKMDVKFNIPESLMIMLRSENEVPDAEDTEVKLQLDGKADTSLPLDFKEFAKRADPITKTYEVTYQVAQPADGPLLLPGMTGTAQVRLLEFEAGQFMVPSRVVFGDIYMNPRVWVLNPENNTVQSRLVAIGRSAGISLAITEGVSAGELLVNSHVAFLREGESVTLADTSAGL